ncbi:MULTISPECIES: DNA replication/repair protein RecF [unclassified Fusibacter]|uniref:DNA replication/repair protein RecF n=1 Tax=unclassified Fusibacter TaxID=2624464 RepID=UPI0010122299|nr:DNA replication/repair protein RecF [Fusibacter sp. A1]MCK8060844.1 DNA replication/repair protein RecF [Fusibacter sp. A2]NPE23140.1 DNA replication/repair protein RecF [Fusibacter sp. A1]RXV59498.1 DNA replication/repair protein RecF [Fusibacter sp. A1]
MHIKRVELTNYRNYNKLALDIHQNANVIIGDNAQGKTNLLEALFFAAFGKSFRTSKDQELIKDEEVYFKLHLDFFKNNRDQTIDLILKQDKAKQILLNGVPLKKISELIGSLNVVLFSPEDLRLIKGGPAERRKFIDREISNLNRMYMDNLINYHKILNHRNKLLKSAQFRKSLLDTIDVWDEQLVHYGVKVIMKRMDFIKKLSEVTATTHLEITDGKEILEIDYFTGMIEQSSFDYDRIVYGFKEKLKSCIDKDVKYGFTSVGPHKDDLIIKINGQDARKYSSQGQQRTAALSMKLSEITLIQNELGERPILLLDDVMSELDLTRRQMLMHAIKGLQTIITTTDLTGLDQDQMAPFQVVEIEKGAVLTCREVQHVDESQSRL